MSLILSGVMNIIQLVAVFVCFVVIDNVGRRPLAIWGAVLACGCYMIIAGLVGSFSDNWPAHTAAGWVAVAMAFLFMFFYGVSYSPLGWCLPSEVYSTAQRSKGVALATATVWLGNFIVGLITPPMIEGAGFGTYIFFGGWCGLAAVWAFFLVPETKGKTLVSGPDLHMLESVANSIYRKKWTPSLATRAARWRRRSSSRLPRTLDGILRLRSPGERARRARRRTLREHFALHGVIEECVAQCSSYQLLY